jgi:hypothetical protein
VSRRNESLGAPGRQNDLPLSIGTTLATGLRDIDNRPKSENLQASALLYINEVRFIPNRSAAPFLPPTTQLLVSSARRIPRPMGSTFSYALPEAQEVGPLFWNANKLNPAMDPFGAQHSC